MYIGIDLGTTNSAVAGNIDSQLRLFKTADGADVLPSVIYIDRRGHRLYGRRAYQAAVSAPQDVARGFKRLMGTSTPIAFHSAGLELTPEECSADILRVLVGQAATESGVAAPEGTVVTIPAAFNQMQTEATLRAIRLAGIGPAVLLQEPIAAAMAALARSSSRSGQFVIYDLGGGTFDVALVQSIAGSINIVAHEGINMLGGQDLDRALVRRIVRPWLLANFSLPRDFEQSPKYRRILSAAVLRAEEAKIELSARERTTLLVTDEEIAVKDETGRDIYIEIALTRRAFEEIVAPSLEETISLTRRVIADNGYAPRDIDRIVFIGGPSKTPWVREHVPQALGIAADLGIDPMTAVAFGAAIYAESRDWRSPTTARKPMRASVRPPGDVGLRYDYPARTADDRARIRVRAEATQDFGPLAIEVSAQSGWSSGRLAVSDGMALEVPLGLPGENAFRANVFDGTGRPIPAASQAVTILRTHASAAVIPATQGLGIKVRAGSDRPKNVLEPLIAKGTPLPHSGSKSFLAVFGIGPHLPGKIELEIYQDEGAAEPELNLCVGAFRISYTDLPDGLALRAADPVTFHWKMDDSGLLDASVELPSIGRRFTSKRFYVDQSGHRSFEGSEGHAFVSSLLEAAVGQLKRTFTIIGASAAEEMVRIESALAELRERLDIGTSADERRSIAERARQLRQALARLCSKPEHKGAALEHDLSELYDLFAEHVRWHADPGYIDRFDRLGRAALAELRRRTDRSLETAEGQIDEMERLYLGFLWEQPVFVEWAFDYLAPQRHLALEKQQFDRLVQAGRSARAAGNTDALRRICFEIFAVKLSTATRPRDLGKLASILRMG
ncbi:MAG: Hsp70 family protein [Alphaproteobacteria bacterium]|nr:Hsp70 family protein [Alphaproteobacteria bacterium]